MQYWAPPPPRKRTLGANIAPLAGGGCARGNAVAMNLQFSLPAAKTGRCTSDNRNFASTSIERPLPRPKLSRFTP
jgi:hypothetical protein